MNKLCKLVILATIITFLSGCGLTLLPSVCDDPVAGESWICETCQGAGVRAEDVDLVVRIVAARAIKKQSHKDAVLNLLNKIEKGLSGEGLTYRMIIKFTEDELTGPEAEFISSRLSMFDSTRLISSFDKALILHHIASVKVLLE